MILSPRRNETCSHRLRLQDRSKHTWPANGALAKGRYMTLSRSRKCSSSSLRGPVAIFIGPGRRNFLGHYHQGFRHFSFLTRNKILIPCSCQCCPQRQAPLFCFRACSVEHTANLVVCDRPRMLIVLALPDYHSRRRPSSLSEPSLLAGYAAS